MQIGHSCMSIQASGYLAVYCEVSDQRDRAVLSTSSVCVTSGCSPNLSLKVARCNPCTWHCYPLYSSSVRWKPVPRTSPRGLWTTTTWRSPGICRDPKRIQWHLAPHAPGGAYVSCPISPALTTSLRNTCNGCSNAGLSELAVMLHCFLPSAAATHLRTRWWIRSSDWHQ